jgi:tetratricopeptide (TPR) repeat protein
MDNQLELGKSSAGKWAVIGVLLLGIAGGTIAVLYWAQGLNVVPDNGANNGPWDRELAIKELAQLDDELGKAKGTRRYGKVLQKAITYVDKYPKFSDGYMLLAKIYIELYQWPRAYEQLEKALKIEYRQPEVHHLAGTVKFAMNFLDEAERHYRTAHQIDPNNAKHLVYLAQVFIRRGEYPKARVMLLDALRINRQLHQAYATMSDLNMKENNARSALQQIEKAIKFSDALDRPLAISYQLKAAAAHRRIGDADAAILTLQDNLQPDELIFPHIATDIALSWGLKGQPELAARFLEKAFEQNHRMDWVLIKAAANWRIKMRDFETATKHIAEIRRLDPKQPAIADLQERIRKAKAAPEQKPLENTNQ